tara:strand:+ start:213 stop:398 length:186 start_codon:yes stop_codon:yes gene_type:complete
VSEGKIYQPFLFVISLKSKVSTTVVSPGFWPLNCKKEIIKNIKNGKLFIVKNLVIINKNNQ